MLHLLKFEILDKEKDTADQNRLPELPIKSRVKPDVMYFLM